MLKANAAKLDPREEHFCIAGPRPDLKLFLRRLPSATGRDGRKRIVLYVHGHLMHLEAMRYALYRESIAFLLGGDAAPAIAA